MLPPSLRFLKLYPAHKYLPGNAKNIPHLATGTSCGENDKTDDEEVEVEVDDDDDDIIKKVSVERKVRQSISASLLNQNGVGHPEMTSQENEEHEIFETRISGNVEGKKVIIIDDLIDTGRNIKSAITVGKFVDFLAFALP